MAFCTTIAIATRDRGSADPWTYYLEFTPTRDNLAGPIEVGGSQVVEATPLVRADDINIKGKKNLAVTYSWTRIKEYSATDYWDTYQALQSTMANYPLGDLEAKVEVYNDTPAIDATTTYAHAAFESIVPRVLSPQYLEISYVLLCANPS